MCFEWLPRQKQNLFILFLRWDCITHCSRSVYGFDRSLQRLKFNFESWGHFRSLFLYFYSHLKALCVCVCMCVLVWKGTGNEAQIVRGSTTKVLRTCVFLCMREDDQSSERETWIAFFSPFLHLFVCVSEGVRDQSTCMWRLLIRLTPRPRAAPLGDCG